MRQHIQPYTCPRCGYETTLKGNMRAHLYKRQDVCPGTVCIMEFTESIKECILKNRIYHVTEQRVASPPTINQVINNYNMINNFVTNMDAMDKLDKITNHKKIDMIGFDDRITDKYGTQIDKLDSGGCKHFFLDTASIMDIIHDITKCDDISTCNVLYDVLNNNIKLYVNGEWECNRFDRGVESILRNIQDCYLDNYEKYLLRKAASGGPFVQSQVKEYLEHYYRILISFDLPSILVSMNDVDVLDNDSLDYTLQEKYYHGLFMHVETTTSVSQANKIKREINDIIKQNSKSNIIELNKQVMELIKVDDEFKNNVLQRLQNIHL